MPDAVSEALTVNFNRKAYSREYYAKNKAKILEYQKQYYRKNRKPRGKPVFEIKHGSFWLFGSNF